MQVVTLHSPQRHWVAVQRPDDERGQRVVILAGWGQHPAEVFRAALPHLEPGEVLAVARALGLRVPPPEAAIGTAGSAHTLKPWTFEEDQVMVVPQLGADKQPVGHQHHPGPAGHDRGQAGGPASAPRLG